MTEREKLIELIKHIVIPYFAEQIADYLLENGIIVPPAYIGQTAYYLFRGFNTNEIIEGKVSMIQQKADKSWKIRLSYRGRLSDFTVEDFGKNVFFTYEAAEKALKEANDERKAD